MTAANPEIQMMMAKKNVSAEYCASLGAVPNSITITPRRPSIRPT